MKTERIALIVPFDVTYDETKPGARADAVRTLTRDVPSRVSGGGVLGPFTIERKEPRLVPDNIQLPLLALDKIKKLPESIRADVVRGLKWACTNASKLGTPPAQAALQELLYELTEEVRADHEG